MAKAETLRVRVTPRIKGACYGNIMWPGKFPSVPGRLAALARTGD